VTPDVVLFDCYAGGAEHGLLRARSAPHVPTGSKVVAYSWETGEALVADALRHGYRGFVHKSLSGSQLMEALERVAERDQVVCGPRAATDGCRAEVHWVGDEARLTCREVDVLGLIAAGHTNAEIAASLHLSINSVKSYVRSAYRKIGATSRSQAVLWGIAEGLGASECFRAVPRRRS
jgi:DNA-binding NarL/FixJ family response regulator